MTTYEGNFDDSHDPLIEEWTRITDADMNVVWEGPSRDFNERLRNRWAAFTDDELEMLRSGLSWFWDRESEGRVRKTEALMRDMDAELERRLSVSDREPGGSS